MGPGTMPYLSPEEYLAIERQAETKSEYLNGRMFPLGQGIPPVPGWSFAHSAILGNLIGCSAIEKEISPHVHLPLVSIRIALILAENKMHLRAPKGRPLRCVDAAREAYMAIYLDLLCYPTTLFFGSVGIHQIFRVGQYVWPRLQIVELLRRPGRPCPHT